MIRRVLVALDDSPRAPGVLRAGLEIAERFDAEVVLLRVILVPPEFPPAAGGASHADAVEATLVAEAGAALRAIAAGSVRACARPPMVREGDAWREIVSGGDEVGADLLVLGSHGYAGLDRILGTTAAKVANHARRNVLIVHERHGATRAPPTESDM